MIDYRPCGIFVNAGTFVDLEKMFQKREPIGFPLTLLAENEAPTSGR